MSSPGRRPGSSRDAEIHLRKAQQFYESAIASLADERFNPVVSDAVVSGINSSDVICIAEAGRRHDSANHEAKIALLRTSGRLSAQAAPILERLLPQKNLAQYRTALAREADARQAVQDAEELLDLARRARSQLP